MWFKRKQKNRRLGRGHVLDVRLRSEQVRATRTRLAIMAVSVPALTVFGLYLLWRTGEWALDKFVYENSEFAIQNIQVQTDGMILPAQLQQWSNVKPGANLIALDLASVKRNLELVSAIQSVSVERVLPRTLKIRVTERKPVAEVNVPRTDASGGIVISIFQLDADGFVMQPLDPHRRVVPISQMNNQWPVITGLNLDQLLPGRRVVSPQAQAALKLLVLAPLAGLADLRRIDISSPQVIVATTGQGGEITFGMENLQQQLWRWREIYDWGVSQKKMIASLDLAVANNVPVRWAEIVSAPAAAPTVSTPANTRRNHV
jgi:hypothetical protein